jgi:hypothetical protein
VTLSAFIHTRTGDSPPSGNPWSQSTCSAVGFAGVLQAGDERGAPGARPRESFPTDVIAAGPKNLCAIVPLSRADEMTFPLTDKSTAPIGKAVAIGSTQLRTLIQVTSLFDLSS